MQTFPPLCIHNFGLPRRTPSPRPSPYPARFLYARPPALQLPRVPAVPPVAVRARPPNRARPRTTTYAATSGRRTRPRRWNGGGPSITGTFPWRRTEVDGAELTRTTTATNDEHALGGAATGAKTWAGRQLAVTWPGQRLARTTYIKMARRKKNARARSLKKISGVGFTLWVCQV